MTDDAKICRDNWYDGLENLEICKQMLLDFKLEMHLSQARNPLYQLSEAEEDAYLESYRLAIDLARRWEESAFCRYKQHVI